MEVKREARTSKMKKHERAPGDEDAAEMVYRKVKITHICAHTQPNTIKRETERGKWSRKETFSAIKLNVGARGALQVQ